MKRFALLMVPLFIIGVIVVQPPASGLGYAWCGGTPPFVILSDSTSTGYGATGYTGGNEDPYEYTDYGWSSQLADAIPNTMYNYARNGALVSDFLPASVGVNNPRVGGPLHPDAIDDIDAIDPGLVIIALGANEYGYGTDQEPNVYETNLRALVQGVRAAVPTVDVLIVHTWLFDMRWPGNSYEWVDYAAVAEDVADDLTADYMDMTEYMGATYDDTAGLYIEDEYGPGLSVHTTDAGHAVQFAGYFNRLRCG